MPRKLWLRDNYLSGVSDNETIMLEKQHSIVKRVVSEIKSDTLNGRKKYATRYEILSSNYCAPQEEQLACD